MPNISWRRVGEITAFLKLFPRIIWLGACRDLPAPRPPPQHRVRLLADYRHNKVTMKLFEKSSLVADEGRKRAGDGPKCVRSS
jgi:hypothetical protein